MTDKELSDIIEAALNEALSNMEDHEDGDILVDWAVITFVANADEGKRSGYPMLFSNGAMPHYRARGLLHTALAHLEDEAE